MRIVLLIHNLDLGGAQVAVLNLARGLAAAGAEPLVVPWRRAGALAPRFREAGIELLSPPFATGGLGRLRVLPWLAGLLRERRIDILHAHLSDSAFWAARLQGRGPVPALTTHHSTALIDTIEARRPLYARFRRWLLARDCRRVAANVAVSRPVQAALAELAGLPPQSIAVLPNALEPPPPGRLEAAMKARRGRLAAGYRQGGPRLVFLGRLDALKGVDRLIAALPALRQRYPGASLQLAGEGPEAAALRHQAEGLGLGPQAVVFHGYVSNPAALLAEADLMVSASRLEGLPLALLEAFSWGLPVLASDIPAHRALNEEGERLRLFGRGEPEDLARALATLLEDPGRELRVEAALRLIAADYTLEAVARAHLDLYARLLSRQPSP